MEETPSLVPGGRPLNLIPVGLKEAALDSPTFRASAVHFAEHIDAVEKWLEGYVKTGTKLVQDFGSLESQLNSFFLLSSPPAQVSEAVLDHDYTLLAARRYGDASREHWQLMFKSIKRSESVVLQPIKHFLDTELRAFKDARKVLEASQRAFDALLVRYAGQGKTKESSSLREDAFQLHEARKSYLKASMDFCIQRPQIRAQLDRLLVRVFSDQWKDFKVTRETSATPFTRWGHEMERVRGWSKEMEHSERAFKRELQVARKQIEDSAEQMARPSRELEDYAAHTVPYLGSGASAAAASPAKSIPQRSEKQGWLYLKTVTGKPARTLWSRRWFFVKNGMFGWLVQGTRSGGVEESERVGVLLCSIRPAMQEDRRFCFEVMTKDTTITLQAETQPELIQWLSAFDMAKRKALEDPASTETTPVTPGVDAAFSISPPTVSELAAHGDGHIGQGGEDQPGGLFSPDREVASRSSIDVSSTPRSRRSTVIDREAGEGSRDHAARLIQKLESLPRKASPSSQASPAPAGGIASLISASHSILPVGPGAPPSSSSPDRRSFTMPASTLAPSTLADPPVSTNLSKTAVVLSGERGVSLSQAGGSGMPSGIMANLWGSAHWGHISRPDQAESPVRKASPAVSVESRPVGLSVDDNGVMDDQNDERKEFCPPSSEEVRRVGHRKTPSMNPDAQLPLRKTAANADDAFPNYYPLPLKAQDAQFRTLFPEVPRSEKVVLVFRATWNHNEQQEFPGRVYATTKEIFFYSNHLGLVLVSGVKFSSITEITAAPGRDCDFLYVHLKKTSKAGDLRRVTIKVFLEPLRLLQRRLNFLVQNRNSECPISLEEVLKALIKMEANDGASSSHENLDEIASPGEDTDPRLPRKGERDVKNTLRIDGSLYGTNIGRTGREVTKFKLPAQAVNYAPQDAGLAAVVKDYNTSAKALFHVVFGDKSAVFQMLYRSRWADSILQTPWTQPENGHPTRQFTCAFGTTQITDTQSIDIMNEHLCYVVTDTKLPFHLPMSTNFRLVTRYVVTHSAKGKCKLAIYNKVIWHRLSGLANTRNIIEKRALKELTADALTLTDVASSQVTKLGTHSKTNKATQIFGNIGQTTQAAQVSVSDLPTIDGSTDRNGRSVQRFTLFGLYRDETLAQILLGVSIFVDIIIAIAMSIARVASTHKLLVLMLLLALGDSAWFHYRDGWTWWHERNATKFMARLGVGASPRISRAVYMADIHDLVASPGLDDLANSTSTGVVAGDAASLSCRTTFQDMLTLSDDDGGAGTHASRGMEARLYRTRYQLASYRHDLMVAMRVVNRVEEEVVQAEWEEWVRDEAEKCARVQRMLGEQMSRESKAEKAQRVVDEKKGQGREFAAYCSSCRTEAEVLKGTKKTRV